MGISFIIIVYIALMHAYCSNCCPKGMGSTSHQGIVRRWMIPDDLAFCVLNNLLEHLATIVTPWVLTGRLMDGDYSAMSMTDSTTLERLAPKIKLQV